MKEKEKPIGVVEFLKAIADDPEVPDKYRIQASALVVDPNANPFAPPRPGHQHVSRWELLDGLEDRPGLGQRT